MEKKEHPKPRILSGMRPTGPMHLGHLFGTLENWVKLQASYHCFFMVADWHALMSEYESPQAIHSNGIDNVRDWLSYGLEPDRCVIFRQSDIPEHLELAMIFSILTPLSWLERCPTYKEQLREIKGRDLTTYGFLGYPVLQAADILVYKANAVPVGQDQLPHLELTREIARRFHALYKKEIFPLPEALLTKEAKVLGLDNRKMSKSYGNFIALSDPPEAVKKKVNSMITDAKKIKKGDPGRPEVCNVFTYQGLFNQSAPLENIAGDCRSGKLGCTECKKILDELLSGFLEEKIQKKRREYSVEKVEEILKAGAVRAREFACQTMREVKKIVSL